MVKMLTRYAGPKGSFNPGELASFTEETEDALVKGKYAERVEIEKPKEPKPVIVERATLEAPETATAPPARRRRKTEE